MALVFLFCNSFYGHIAQFLFFSLLVWFSGKKNNLFITFMIMAGIVIVNLLAPYGKVIAAIGPLRITDGSLFMGIEKALTLEALVMLSRACIKNDLKLPGTVGSLLGESFRMLAQMQENRDIIGHVRIVERIDRLMLKMESINTGDVVHGNEQKRDIKSIVVLFTMVLLTATMGMAL
jgi:heptaprenyl diphosphate synthase